MKYFIKMEIIENRLSLDNIFTRSESHYVAKNKTANFIIRWDIFLQWEQWLSGSTALFEKIST